MSDIIVGGLDAFEIVAFDQPAAGLPVEQGGELPRQIFRILNAGIGTAGAERRNLMRGIADKDHPIVHETIEAAAVERVNRNPFELVGVTSKYLVEPRADALRLL